MTRTNARSEEDYSMMSYPRSYKECVRSSLDVWDGFIVVQTFMFLQKESLQLVKNHRHRQLRGLKQIKPSHFLSDHSSVTLLSLTLCTVHSFVADGAHTIAVGAGAMAAAKRVDALCDGDIALRALPATVAHTGALVVLAVATAEHRARRWRSTDREGKEGRD